MLKKLLHQDLLTSRGIRGDSFMIASGTLALMGTEEAKQVMQAALGRLKADLVIVHAKLANVYTGEWLDDYAVAVKGKWIVYVGKDPQYNIGRETTVIDAAGSPLIPGFIDGHTHLSHKYDSAECSRYAIKGGTTTIIYETQEAHLVGGYEAAVDYLESFAGQPVKFFGTIAAMVSISSTCNGLPLGILIKLLQRDDVIGLGEAYWQAVMQNPDQFLPLFAETLRCGKLIEGHSAGASGRKLMAYSATGITSCHEPTTAEEALERLRIGLYVMVREGSIRQELDDIARLKDMDIDFRRLILATDGVDPKDMVAKGYMEFIVQKAIDKGFKIMDAVRMATINVAEHFSLDGTLGGIAPGKYADMIIIQDMKTIAPRYVISNGRVALTEGVLTVSPRKHAYTEASRHSIHLPLDLKAEDFCLSVEGNAVQVKVRIIDQITELVTRELQMEMPVINGEIIVDVAQDIIKVAAIDRRLSPGRKFVGLLRGFHMREGAFATSAAWDSSDIIVIGVHDADMALAVNRIHALQGGIVVSRGGQIIAELPLPVLGLISDEPMESLSKKLDEINTAAFALGISFSNPSLTLDTLSTAAIPYFRICEEGLVNLKDGKTVGLIVL
uniref:adenine deaminase n=1 Tax=uncultured Desulfobacterium sp. TaxID=201089 RepID=E1YIS0_9BACT|nr:hypothetical protein N47_K27040 [uncultured Desulfobacterium sp.]